MCFILIMNRCGRKCLNGVIVINLKSGTQQLKYIPFRVTLLEINESREILYLKLVKLVIHMHLSSFKLLILCSENT